MERRPQQRQSTRQIADCVGTCVATVILIDDVHLFHQIFMTEVWVPLGDTSVVQGKKAEATSSNTYCSSPVAWFHYVLLWAQHRGGNEQVS